MSRPKDHIGHLFRILPNRSGKEPITSGELTGMMDIITVIDEKFVENINVIYAGMPEDKREEYGDELILHAWQVYAIALSAFDRQPEMPDKIFKDKKVLKKTAKIVASRSRDPQKQR